VQNCAVGDRSHRPAAYDAADNPSSPLVVCKLTTTYLSVAKCQ